MKLPHQTAISRRALSAPARLLQTRGLIEGATLDYGCGRGKDREVLGCDGYDPHWAPTDLSEHTGHYQTVLCTYVLNVVDEETEGSILSDIKRLLAPGGRAYITVRRDLKEWKGIQRLVRLAEPVLIENSGYCIYTIGG